MKRRSLLLLVFAFLTLNILAQSVPRGMSYQAVARDKSGGILANQIITLKVDLKVENGPDYFTEIHRITTNQFGLFNLVIGKGSTLSGDFNEVPWSTKEIWMEISIKDENSADYTAISSTKLLTVPYAFHAQSASELIGNGTTYTIPYSAPTSGGSGGGNTINGSGNGTPWTMQGNYNLNLTREYLGTSDNADLPIRTNAIERMRVKNTGDVNIVNTLNIGNGLNVSKSVNLNSTGGATINNGQLTVVGLTRLNEATQSTSPSTGSLVVIGGTGIGKDLNVGGNLNIAGASTFTGTLVTNDLTESTSPSTGALIVGGGAGIGKRLNVGGAGKFSTTLEAVGATTLGNTLTVAGITTVNNNLIVKDDDAGYVATIENTNTSTGDGLLIKLGKKATKNNSTAIASDAALSSINQSLLNPTVITNITNLIDDNPSNDPSITEFILATIPSGSEAIQLGQTVAATACFAGIEVTNTAVNYLNEYLVDNTNSALSLPLNLTAPINSGLGLPIDLAAPINSGIGLPFDLSAEINDGLGLPISLPSALGGATIVPGLPSLAIPAIPSIIIPSIPDLILPAIPQIPTINTNVCSSLGQPYNFARLTLNDAWTPNPLNHENTFITFADKSSTEYALGAITAQSVTDWITGYITPKNVYHVLALFGGLDPKKIWAEMKEQAIVFKDDYLKIGVQYSSGSGDYAEWLERVSANEVINAGDIVGVKSGKITKNLSDAEQVMAVSFRPIVLGNIPTRGKEELGNNVAFMGQIPVKVMGPVSSGDYIVGNLSTPGYGVAINPSNMRTEDFKYAVGRSWDSDNSSGAKMVNTVVGVHNGEFVRIVQQLEQRVANSDQRMETIEAKLEQLSKAIPTLNNNGVNVYSKK